ncbi:NADH:flavin oxidoreductase [Methylosinus sp. Sm6]|uniref:oxidoreductase n=1 Tax=Methylosinus sp. Sm6 TaxID=2866948 RepID=UPI001C99EAFC|nr:NADH:flavin oxidoreductase [Methylosinus sp. Sm6]MBY6242612.1 NADH:flavin oxidoreductase [Methylosinus sp. Sm6]
MQLYPEVTAPLRLGRLSLKNRIYFAPMGLDMADECGGMSEELARFYRGVIDGGCGMVVLGNSSIDPSTRLHERGLCLYDDDHARKLEPLLSYGASRNCPVVIQLQHYGAQGGSRFTGMPLLAPSAPKKYPPRASGEYRTWRIMDVHDIAAVRRQFANAARLAQSAGAAMIQLQASNGYLLGSFLSPYTNRREDAYGGSALRRARFLLEVVGDIHDATRGGIDVTVRLGVDDCLGPEGQEPHLLGGVVRALERVGVAAIMCSMSIRETFHYLIHPTLAMRRRLIEGVQHIRAHTSLPVGFAGFTASMEQAESLLADRTADLIGMTRAIFADNDLVAKSLAGRQSAVEACHFDGNCFRDKANPALDRVYCCVNPKYKRPEHIRYA